MAAYTPAYIPMSILAEIIEEWLERNLFYINTGKWGDCNGTWMEETGINHLSAATGIAQRRLYSIRKGEERTAGKRMKNGEKGKAAVYTKVTFDTADKLLCGMNMASEWHLRLKEFYDMPIPLTKTERELEAKQLELAA